MSEMTPARATALVDRLARLLRDEIAAIGKGELARVEELFPRKQELLAEIETVFADPEALLEGEDAASAKLRARLSDLRKLIHSDLSLLQRMTEATGAVAREIDRIRERQSLRGVYGRDGSKKPQCVTQTQRYDHSV
ncbi:flagellar protein FlgN [Alloyangia pacifica]|uniref:flagellar protein FlgN n=1 Tax=Alloyangia pacifica TaxID=311180 RepID=UPI001CD76103|nr:flagellar protein FlgN [Alloyangia pacifica]MCA0994912.1 flagellar protein FlgN [Alloyangia pacifica]